MSDYQSSNQKNNPGSAQSALANRKGQSLVYHSILTARLAQDIIQTIYESNRDDFNGDGELIARLSRTAFLSGLLHDIGKLVPDFQGFLRSITNLGLQQHLVDGEHLDTDTPLDGFTFNEYPRHEEISWLLLCQWFDKKKLARYLGNPVLADCCFYTVYWHHARPWRDSSITQLFESAGALADRLVEKSTWLEDESYQTLVDFLEQIETITGAGCSELLVDDTFYMPVGNISTPPFKESYSCGKGLEPHRRQKSLNHERNRTAVRSAVVSADRIVSRLSAQAVQACVEQQTLPEYQDNSQHLATLYQQISTTISRFASAFPDDRTRSQTQVSQELAADTRAGHIACLQGPAGCGKTKVALEYLLELDNQRRIVMFVPRTAIGEALFFELINDYQLTTNIEYLSGTVKRFCTPQGEVIETPEHLQRTGDLLITTIDQLCASMLSHQKIDFVTELAQSHVIVDEVHEVADLPGIAVLFMEMMKLRAYVNTGTLLISATPNPYFLDQLGVDEPRRMPTFNNKPYRVRVNPVDPAAYHRQRSIARTAHPFLNGSVLASEGSFIVCNTAALAQQSSIVHCNHERSVICLHSRFTASDKSALINRVLNDFGKGSSETSSCLVAGPIVQASLNISTGHEHTEASPAENFLQRLGRLNRFAEHEIATVDLYIAWDQTADALANKRVLSWLNQSARTIAFVRFLMGKLGGHLGEYRELTVTLSTLYDWYVCFHADPAVRDAYESDFNDIMKASERLFENSDFDPIYFAQSRQPPVDDKMRLAAQSLRGKSYYVLPMRVRVAAGSHTEVDQRLLWNSESSHPERLTDELRVLEHLPDRESYYLKLSKSAAKPSTVSPVLAGAEGTRLLKSIARAMQSVKRAPGMLRRARHPDSPVLVSSEKFDANNLYYIEYHSTLLGLMSPDDYDGVSSATLSQQLKK